MLISYVFTFECSTSSIICIWGGMRGMGGIRGMGGGGMVLPVFPLHGGINNNGGLPGAPGEPGGQVE
jgi:hypothetical protein